MTDPTLEQTLLVTLCKGEGPFKLQRRLQKARLERPEQSIPELLTHLLNPDDALQAPELIESLRQRQIKWVSIFDQAYPRMLAQIADPPPLLFYSGTLPTLQRPGVAIVGSRKCTTYGEQVSRKLAAELANLGFVIISGLALGIDTHAHRACLDVKGRTIAVLGSGIDGIHPSTNRPLARDIVHNQGTIISELPPGSPIRPFHFPFRNRIISGLSHACVVVEAADKSGTLITARHCLDQGRDLFAVPGPINRDSSSGTNRLIHDGEAELLLGIPTLLERMKPLLGLAAAHQTRISQTIDDPIAKKIYERLDAFEPIQLDLIIADLGLDASTVLAKLAELEGGQMVESKPGQHFVRNPLHSTR